LFEAPSVEALAARVESLKGEGPQAPPLVPAGRDGALPLSFAQQRLWFIDQLAPGRATYNIPHALRLRGALDVAALERSLGEVVRRHESLRTRIASTSGEPSQVIDAPRPLSLQVVDLMGRGDADREAALRDLAIEEATRPFDLAAG